MLIKTKSIQFRLYTIILFIVLILFCFILGWYLDTAKYSIDHELKSVVKIEKLFSDIISNEHAVLNKPSLFNSLFAKYTRLTGICLSCHAGSPSAIVIERETDFNKLFKSIKETKKIYSDINSILMNLISSVKYIHEHHIVYLKNLQQRNIIVQDYYTDEAFERSSVKAATEPDIIQSAVTIQTSLISVYDIFNNLQQHHDIKTVKKNFSDKIGEFFLSVNTFENYSLDAQDGILVEELLQTGRYFEKRFFQLLNAEVKKNELKKKLTENELLFLKTMNMVKTKIEIRNSNLSRKIKLIQILTLGITALLCFWIIFTGKKIINQVKKTVEQTNRIQKDFSYQIEIDDDIFDEFKIGFKALNAMSYGISDYIDKLNVSEEKYRNIFKNAVAGFYQSTPEGRFIDVNPAFASMLGFDCPEELISKISDIATQYYSNPEDRQRYATLLKRYEIVQNLEYQVKRKDGSKIWISTNARVVYSKDRKVTLYEGYAIDITARKHAEDEKKIAQKVAADHKKLALVGQIAGKMAHDFNNVLGIIMGNAELSLLDCRDVKIKKTLELIFDQTIRGKNLTRNLIAFARNQEPKQEYFNISGKIDFVVSLLKNEFEQIKLIKEVLPNIPDLLADSGMIEHALVNLLQNSIHALSRVKHPRIVIRINYSKGNIYLEIEDNGCGIPEEHLKSIYDPSFTLKGSCDVTSSYNTGIKGTGYGMSNIKKYVELHKGEIFVESQFGVGTKIILSLPVIKKELTSQEKKEMQTDKIHSEKKILLVEDEQAISDVQYRILTQEPCSHKVDTALNGQVAMDLFDRNEYDLISLDYALPGGINGMDVYNYIRKMNNKILILFVSGNIEFLESIKELKQKDVNIDHISKPCQNKDYVDNINKLLGKIFA